MEKYNDLWQKCLRIIREKIGDKDKEWYQLWFGDIRFERYDPATRTLTLQVPSKYVWAYIERYWVDELQKATAAVFRTSIRLQYRIMPPVPTDEAVANYLRLQGRRQQRNPRLIRVANARQRMEERLKSLLKGKPVQWLDGYDRVAEWLTDNKGKGLLVMGAPGLGKSLICQQVIPVLIATDRPVVSVNARELHNRLDELKREPVVVIDDLGKEPRKFFGDTDQSFYELCDNAEHTGNILIVTTNLATAPVPGYELPDEYSDTIQNRYGDEVLSRLKSIMRTAEFRGSDLRK